MNENYFISFIYSIAVLDLPLKCKSNIQPIWVRFKIYEIQLQLSLGYIAWYCHSVLCYFMW